MLSRQIAESGIYPPVDVEPSVSRSMLRVASPAQLQAAQRFREVYSYYLRHRDLITVGAYRAGADAQLDRAVELWPRIEAFMSQDQNQPVGLAQSIRELTELVSGPMPARPQPDDPSAPTQGSEHAS